MPSAGDVSVVIPHYGDPAHAQRLVSQLRSQRDGVELEIIVLDDCSPVPFPPSDDAIVHRRDTNGGFGAAVNSAAQLATRTQLLILNSDLDVPEDFVQDLLTAAAPWQPAVSAPALVGDDGELQWSGRHFPRTHHYVTEWLRPLARWRHRRSLHEAVGHDSRCVSGATVATDWLVGAVLLLPTELFRDEGGFDERFHMYCEETDLQRRLRDRGIPSIYLGELQVKHAGGASTDSSRRLGWLFSSRFFYARKWGTGAGRLHAGLVAATVVNAIFAALRGPGGGSAREVWRREIEIVNSAAKEGKRKAAQMDTTAMESVHR
ncbi:glycosyltransferase family 2 protein [Gulosibacter molinativorax]|uniref:glycosyltransferase family 2 protein n=1 Tax=Gulosibacter molinativorax TaxID=256821 RepID=UPI0006885029|nr:glycosyltransferase family 2 protein [Gulosibacter molinativorax]